MRDQYVGDVSDLLKYALLRRLAAADRGLGVAWYYNQAYDGRNDGRHTEYLGEDKWQALDSWVLSALGDLSERSVTAVEQREPEGAVQHSQWARGHQPGDGGSPLDGLQYQRGKLA